MATVDLTQLATATSAQLQDVWNIIGINEAERTVFLGQLTVNVQKLYESAVAGQQERLDVLQEEVAALQHTITNMQHAMDLTEDVVRRNGIRVGPQREEHTEQRAVACKFALFPYP